MRKLLLWISFLNFTLALSAQSKSDSLWSIWSDESQTVINRLEALQSMHTDEMGMFRPANPDTAYYHAQLQYDLAKANNLKKWMGKALQRKGNYYSRKGAFHEAIDYYDQGKTIGEEIGDKELIADNTWNLGLTYSKKGNADQGIAAFSQAAEIYEELGLKRRLSFSLEQLASIYYFLKLDSKRALAYLNQAIAIREELVKTDNNPADRFVINGMKNTIESINKSFEKITDTIDLNTYTWKDAKENQSVNTPAPLLIAEVDIAAQEGIDVSLEYLIKSIATLEETGNKPDVADVLNKVAVIYEGENDFANALDYYFQALKIYEELGEKNSIGNSLYNIGRVYYYQSNIDQALDYLIRGRIILKEVGNLLGYASVQNMIAIIYSQQGDYSQALNIFSENLTYFEETGNKVSKAVTLSAIGTIYRNQGDNDKALKNITVALKTFEEINAMRGIAGTNLEIAAIYLDQKKYELALKNLTRSLTISEKIGYQEGTLLAQGNIANVYAAQGNHAKAISFGTNALNLSQQFGNMNYIMQSAETLNTSYKATGNYKKALEMNELYFQMRDSLQSEENQKAIIQLQVQTEYEKQKAIDDLENEKRVAIETQKKENQQKLSIAIGIGLLLISLLALVIFNRLKVTRQQKNIIEEQKKKVEQSEKYKEQFLANMSHEIRTPMHAISGMTNILVRKEHLKHQEKFFQAIKKSSRNLLVILNDILDLSKIEAGKIDIQSIPMNPREVVLNVSDLLRVKAEEKGLSLHTDLTADIPEYVYGDSTRLNQILLNLLGNAIKFTEKGSVSLSVTTDVDKLRFAVRDSGIGIPSDQLGNIFNSFEQVNDSITRKHGGTGLGLAIAKQLITLQNGRIWVESQENIGSTFFFELPLLPVEADKKLQGQLTDDQLKEMAASLSGLNILVVEDDELNAIIVQEDLEYYINDVTVGFAENGREAVQQFETGDYDLILMDIQMPELNGYDATQAIRKIEAAQGTENPIRIIAMTASLLKSEIERCYTAGMDGYIPKPYKMEELIWGMYEEVKK